MAQVSIETNDRAPLLDHVLEANGRDMSGAQQDRAMTADRLHLNGTAGLAVHEEEMNTAVIEFKVFNIVIFSLALCILTFTGLYYVTVCYNRTRQSKRAQVYESAVTRGEPVNPVAVKAVKRSTSFINPLALFRRPEAAKDNSRIYYIYSNPLPVGLKEEEVPVKQTALSLPLSLQEFTNDPNSGDVLDPPIFYMQL